MLSLVERRVEERMHRVADQLVDHAAMLDDDGRDAFEVAVQDRHQLLRSKPIGHRREPFDVGEQRGDLPPLAGKLQDVRVGDDQFHHLRRKVLRETLPHPRLALLRDGEVEQLDHAEYRERHHRRQQRIDQKLRFCRQRDAGEPDEAHQQCQAQRRRERPKPERRQKSEQRSGKRAHQLDRECKGRRARHVTAHQLQKRIGMNEHRRRQRIERGRPQPAELGRRAANHDHGLRKRPRIEAVRQYVRRRNDRHRPSLARPARAAAWRSCASGNRLSPTWMVSLAPSMI